MRKVLICLVHLFYNAKAKAIAKAKAFRILVGKIQTAFPN